MNKSNKAELEALTRSELEERLRPIAERNSAAVVVFAGRSALRIFSGIAGEGNLNFWPEADQPRYLTAIWFAALSAVANADAAVAKTAANAALAAATSISVTLQSSNATQIDENAVRTTANVIRAADAAIAAARAATYSGADIARAAADAVFSAVSGVAAVTDSVGDLTTIENDELLSFNAPLYESGPVEIQKMRLGGLKRVIKQLIENGSGFNSPVPELVAALPTAFERILEGTYTQEEANHSVQAMFEYFKSIEETNSNPESSEQANNPEYLLETETETDTEKSTSIKPPIFEFEPTRQQSPEATSKEDYLNRLQLVNALAAILADPANDQHQTLGLLGEWGSGKSTWLGFLKAALINNHSEQPYVFGSFNAWAYEHTENLQAGIAHEMVRALVATPGGKNWFSTWWWGWKLKGNVAVALNGWPKMLELLYKFIAAIVPFAILAAVLVPELKEILEAKTAASAVTSTASSASATVANTAAANSNLMTGLLTLGAGFFATLVLIKKSCLEQWKAIWASPEAKELLTYLKLPDYAKHLGEIPVMRKTLEKFCAVRLIRFEKKNTRLLFVVDDLDRCSHQGIVKVFEAVRLVLDIPNVIVIIAVDQHIALAALALHYKELAQHHKLGSARAIARDYLAKVIHLPIILSRPAPAEVENYLKKIWSNGAPEIHAAEENQPTGLLTLAPRTNTTQHPSPSTAIPPQQVPANSSDTTPEVTPAVNSAGLIESSQSATTQTDHTPQTTPEPIAEIKPPTKLKGLTFGQKDAFIYWATYFGLTNPRQLKRLNNTYSLLLNAFPAWDKKSTDVEFGEVEDKIFYPILVTLVTLEYLNARDDPGLRKRLKAKLASGGEGEEHGLISSAFLTLFAALERDAGLPLMQTLEPFVLPAIECEEKPKRYRKPV